jgi:hypothetical protein
MTPETIRKLAAIMAWLAKSCEDDLQGMDGEPEDGPGLSLDIAYTRRLLTTLPMAERALTDFAELVEGIDAARTARAAA